MKKSQFSAGYTPMQPMGDTENGLTDLDKEDKALKARVRRLRLLSRTLTTLLALGAFVPIAVTLRVFLTTKNDFRTVNNPATNTTVYRNLWAKNSKDWPTFLYFSMTLTSLLLNLSMLFSYLHSVRLANLASTFTTIWEYSIILLNFGFWLFAVIIYRTEKDKNGVSNDLWGWTCSTGARNIQGAFHDLINFERMCRVQGSSWIIGLVQTGSIFVSAVILWYVLSRRKVRREVRRSTMGITK